MNINYLMLDSASYDVFIILIIAWVMYIALKMLYPVEFKLNMSRPKIYYREFQARSTHFFSDYRILSGIAIALVWSVAMKLIFSFFDNLPIIYLILVSFLYILMVFLIQYIWQFISKNYSYLSFLRFSHLNKFAFYAGFILFVLWSIPLPSSVKMLIFLIVSFFFYFTYLYAEWRLAKELSVKEYMNILYLCTLDIIPFGILIVLITSRL